MSVGSHEWFMVVNGWISWLEIVAGLLGWESWLGIVTELRGGVFVVGNRAN